MRNATDIPCKILCKSATPAPRPSVLDPASGDAESWIKRCEAGQRAVLYVQSQPVAMVAALPFDVVSLNCRLFELGRKRPRDGAKSSAESC
jgi:hypothetical protein